MKGPQQHLLEEVSNHKLRAAEKFIGFKRLRCVVSGPHDLDDVFCTKSKEVQHHLVFVFLQNSGLLKNKKLMG